MNHAAKKRLLVSGAAMLLAMPNAALAQAPADTAPGTTDPIVVTGTRIPRVGIDTVEPASILDSKQIDRLGYTNLGTALSELPQFSYPTNSLIGTSQSPFATGQTFIDLYGLGSQRTLTLVDGRRFVSSNTPSVQGPGPGGQVDYNLIPETLVDRIEVLSVGGAPIYGSDAIAGTVNVILKHDFQGLDISGENGISQRGDAAEHRLSATYGHSFAGGRGNISVSGQWNRDAALTTAARQLSSADGPFFGLPADDEPFAQQLYYGQRIAILSPYGIPLAGDSIPQFAGFTDANGNVLAFNRAGRLVPFDFGTSTGTPIISAGGDGFRANDYGTLLSSNQRYLGTVLAHFDASDALHIFGEGWYSHSRATNPLNQTYYSSRAFGAAGSPSGNLVVGLDNPFLNPADAATIASQLPEGQDSFLLARANTDLQVGRFTSTVEMYRFVGGVEGDFSLIGKPWHYEASLNYGHSRTISRAPQLVYQNLQNALNATTDASGNIVCAPGYTNAAVATLSSACTPIDLFGQSNTAMQRAAIDYVTAIARSVSTNTQFVADLNAHGTLFTLPGGAVALSVGYEHRRESASFDPGAFYYGDVQPDGARTAFGNGVPVDPIAGAFHTDEIFSELRVPVVSPEMGLRFLHRFELEASARYVHNSLSGGAWTYTAGGSIAPIEDITFRGNYTRSIRSPAITEVFNPTSSSFGSGADPCDVRFIDNGPDPARRAANCAAAGVPQGFQSNYSSAAVQTTISGNPDLRNEQADSFTFGAVLRPRFLPGFTAAADYVHIALKDAIVPLGGDQVLDACYDAANYPSSFCKLVTRGSDGQITLIQEGYYNAQAEKLRAVTADVSYRFNLRTLGLGERAGMIDLGVHYYHLIDQYTQIGIGDVDHSAGEIGNPHDSFTANLNYTRGGLSILWQTEYFGPSVFDADAPATAYQYPGVGHWFLFNGSIGGTIAKRYDLRLIVNNITDARPPFPVPAGGGTITYISGIVGRAFRVTAGLKL